MRLLIRISILLLIGFHLKGQHVYENVIFQKINEVKLTRSEWKIACVFEIQTIIDYVQLISKDISQVNQIILNVERDYKQSTAAMALIKIEGLLLDVRDNSGFSQTFSKMRNEIKELTLAHRSLQTELQSYAFLSSSSRNRRSLIPIVGRVLSGAFGLATTSQVRALRAGIKCLYDNQEKNLSLGERSNVNDKFLPEIY